MTRATVSWILGRIFVDGRTLRTTPLETWWTDFDQNVTDWKCTRCYVDARDVTKESFRHHPAHWLTHNQQRLLELLEHTPIFALGSDQREIAHFQNRGARLYSIGFSRNADNFLTVSATGPGLSRKLAGPLHLVEAAVREKGRARGDDPLGPGGEILVDRIMRAISDGRMSRCSLDLAEIWSALGGGPSMFVFEPDERQEYVGMLVSVFDEMGAKIEAQRELVECIQAALVRAEEASEQTVELPELGWAFRQELPAAEIKKTAKIKPESVDGVTVDWDGRSKALIPAEHQWVLRVAPEPFVPLVRQHWREKAVERQRKNVAKWKVRSNRDRNVNLLILAAVVLVIIGGGIYLTRKPSYGAPCEKGNDCRSGLCKKLESGGGMCVAACGRGCWQGTRCQWDTDLGIHVCVRE